MLLHPREGHVEFLGKVGDRSVCTRELLQHAASGDVGERGERGVEMGSAILNHMVQYVLRIGSMQAEAERAVQVVLFGKWGRHLLPDPAVLKTTNSVKSTTFCRVPL